MAIKHQFYKDKPQQREYNLMMKKMELHQIYYETMMAKTLEKTAQRDELCYNLFVKILELPTQRKCQIISDSLDRLFQDIEKRLESPKKRVKTNCILLPIFILSDFLTNILNCIFKVFNYHIILLYHGCLP